jgi:tyrosinase
VGGYQIFWMHHCNIDRLWASWNAAGRSNPTTSTWKDKTFVFADANGQRVDPRVGDFSDIAPLGYSYDKLEPVPDCPASALTALEAAAMQLRARASAPVALSDRPVRVSLLAPAGAEAFSLSEGIEALDDRRLYVMVKGLEAEAQPEVLYHVYLGLPAGADPAAHEESHVGTINFFNAPTAGMEAMAESFVSFDVTEVARKLKSAGSLGAETSVTVAPAGQPTGAAGARLGELTLVEQ